MRKWKCISVNNGNSGDFTIGKIYETDDEGYNFIVDGGHKIKNLSLIDEMKCYDEQLQFNEIKEEEKKVNKFKVGDVVEIIGNCNAHCFKVGEKVKLYELWDNEDSGIGVAFLAQRLDGEYIKANVVRTKDLKLNEISTKTITITTSDSTTILTDGVITVSVNRYYTDKNDEEIAVSEVTDKYYDELARIEREKNTPKVGDKVKVIRVGQTYDTYSKWLIENNASINSAIKWKCGEIPSTKAEYKVARVVKNYALIEDDYNAYIINIEGLEVIK